MNPYHRISLGAVSDLTYRWRFRSRLNHSRYEYGLTNGDQVDVRLVARALPVGARYYRAPTIMWRLWVEPVN